VLDTQFVVVPGIPNEAWKVVVGSGMGLTMSGDISDGAFYSLVERDFMLKEDVISEYNILYYARYKDDGIIVSNAPFSKRWELAQRMRQRAKFFEIDFEKVSSYGTEFLDVVAWKGLRWQKTGHLDHSVYFKLTSQWIPLSPNSGQSDSVHRAWPKAQLGRYEKLCCHESDYVEATNRFKNLVVARSGFRGLAVGGLLDPPDHFHCRKKERLKISSRITLAFRREWQSAQLVKKLPVVSKRWQDLLQETNVGISWKNPGRHLAMIVRDYNMAKHKNAERYQAVR